MYLRKFKQLNTLNLHGNLFCKDEQYHAYTIAHLTSLVYLDYRLVDSKKREEAMEKFPDSIDELTQDEMILERKLSEERNFEEKRAIHKVQVHMVIRLLKSNLVKCVCTLLDLYSTY